MTQNATAPTTGAETSHDVGDAVELVFVLSHDNVLPGPYASDGKPLPGVETSGWSLKQFDTAPFISPLSKAEAEWVLSHRCVLSRTYSMQQSDFARHGFFRLGGGPGRGVGQVILDSHVQIIGLETRDRYDIFVPAVQGAEIRKPITYDSLDEWRASQHGYAAYRKAQT